MIGFVQARIRSNPVIMRILRKPSRLTKVWRLIGLASLCDVAGLLFVKDTNVFSVPVLLAVLLLFINPILALFIAIDMVHSTIKTKSQEYDLLCVTELSDMKIVEGHVFAAFYRIRVFLVLMMVGILSGIIPEIQSDEHDWCSRYRTACQIPDISVIVHAFLVLVLFALIAVGLVLLVIILTTVLYLWLRNRYFAGLGTLILIIPFIGSFPDISSDLQPAILYTIEIYLMAFIVLITGQYFARPQA